MQGVIRVVFTGCACTNNKYGLHMHGLYAVLELKGGGISPALPIVIPGTITVLLVLPPPPFKEEYIHFSMPISPLLFANSSTGCMYG